METSQPPKHSRYSEDEDVFVPLKKARLSSPVENADVDTQYWRDLYSKLYNLIF